MIQNIIPFSTVSRDTGDYVNSKASKSERPKRVSFVDQEDFELESPQRIGFVDQKHSKQESPINVSCSLTPIEETHISWKDDSEIATVRIFQRTNDEYWTLFSRICPDFPEIESIEQAKSLLKSFKEHPYISYFTPLFSKVSCPKALSITYDRIKNNFMSSLAVKICGFYLLSKSYDNTSEFCARAANLLRGGYCQHSTPNMDREEFDQRYRKAVECEDLFSFVQTLSELIPLEEMAEIRMNADMISILNLINPELDLPQIHGYKGYKSQMSALKIWLEDNKDPLNSITTLDLSQTDIQRIPRELFPYLRGVQTVHLQNSVIQDPAILIDILQLPSLKHLDFSGNQFADFEKFSSVATLPLASAIENAKHLQTFNFSGNGLTFGQLSDLINTCHDRSINLLLDAFTYEEQDLIYVCLEINKHLAKNAQIPIPVSSLLYPDDCKQKILHSLEKRKRAIQAIEELDLSEYYMIFFLPELIPFLSSVRTVVFNQNYHEGFDFSPALENILKLPSLESISLDSNNITTEFLRDLAPHILESQTIKEIFLRNNPLDLGDLPDFTSECLRRNIRVCYSTPKKQRDFITFCNDLHLTKSPIERKNYKSYLTLTGLLPAIFSEAVTEIDISGATSDEIPEEILPYFSDVESVKFSGSQSSPEAITSMIKSVLKLPKIKSVDFSSNNLTNEDLSELIEDFKQATSLKSINLMNNVWDPDVHQEFIQYCYDHNIALTRPISQNEGDYMAVLLKIQNYLSSSWIVPIRFMNHNHILEILPELLEKSTTALASIKHLDFSDMKINRFPSILIPYLSGVTSVCLRNTTPDPTHSDNRLGGIKNHQLLANVLNLPNLQEIDFTNNELSSASIACLIFFVQKSDKKLKKINVTNCLCPRDLFESLVKACSDNNVDIVY